MATKGTPVQPKEIARMLELYEQLGTYAAVAKKLRRSPSTVAKYVSQHKAVQYYEKVVNQIATKKENV